MDAHTGTNLFLIMIGICGTMYCCEHIISKCVKKIKNTPWIFTPPHTPESNRPPPNSPANSDYSIESHETLPSPSTMKPDYSSSEDYIDIYMEYHENNQNRNTPSPTNRQVICEV
jgi:hypothetical protein